MFGCLVFGIVSCGVGFLVRGMKGSERMRRLESLL